MLHRHLFCCVLLLHVLFATAQDPFISQFFANRMYLNPAFTGIEDGLQANITARNQWYAADKGYSFTPFPQRYVSPVGTRALG